MVDYECKIGGIEDLPAIVDLCHEYAREYNFHTYDEDLILNLWNNALLNKGDWFSLIVLEDRVIGFSHNVMCKRYFGDIKAHSLLFYVAKDYQKTIAPRLLARHCIEQARLRGAVGFSVDSSLPESGGTWVNLWRKVGCQSLTPIMWVEFNG